MTGGERWAERARGWLSSPKAPWLAALAALALLSPSLGYGLRLDDRWMRSFALHRDASSGLTEPAHRLFSFLDSAGRVDALRRVGAMPWYSNDEVRVSFFRPLSSLLHALEYRSFGEHFALMHAVSIGWLLALVAVATALYRQLFAKSPAGALASGMASVFFALDGTHGLAAGWLAQRNALVAATFSGLAVLTHDRSRRDGARWAAFASPLFLFLSLCSAEAGTSTALVLLAHALCLEPRGKRASALLPHVPAVALWAALYVMGGYGVRSTGMYLDPIRHPVSSLLEALVHLPCLLAFDLGFPLAELWALAPTSLRAVTVAGALVMVAGFSVGLRPLLARDPMARFFALASVLAALPGCLTAPSARLLVLAGFYLIGLLALAACALLDRPPALPPALRTLHRAVVGWACVGHLTLGPLGLVSGARQMVDVEAGLAFMVRGFPDERADRLVVVNSPDLTFLGYGPLLAPSMGKPAPASLLLMGNGNRPVDLVGVDAHSVLVRNQGGFVRSTTDTLTRSAEDRMPVGTTFDLGDVRVEITHVDQRHVADEALFRFARPLDDPGLAWRAWGEAGLEPVAPPRPGEQRHFEPRSFLALMLRAAAGELPPPPGRLPPSPPIPIDPGSMPSRAGLIEVIDDPKRALCGIR